MKTVIVIGLVCAFATGLLKQTLITVDENKIATIVATPCYLSAAVKDFNQDPELALIKCKNK